MTVHERTTVPAGDQPDYQMSRERYESILRSIDGVVWEAQAHPFRFTFVNERAEKLLGFPAEQWLAEPLFWKTHLHPADQDRVSNFFSDLATCRESGVLEYRIIAADGRIVWLQDRVTSATGDDGIGYLRGLMIDITDRMSAVDELQSNEYQMRLLLEQVPAFVWSTDNDLRVTRIAGRTETNGIHGVGSLLSEYFETDDPDCGVIALHRRALSGESGSDDVTWKDRSYEVYVRPLRNSLGDILGCVGAAHDVTELKVAADNISKEKQFTEALLDSLPGAFIQYDTSGNRVRWNKYIEDRSGYSTEELEEMPLFTNVTGEHKPKMQQAFNDLLISGQTTFEFEIAMKDGRVLPYFVTARVVEIGGRKSIIGIGIDIADLKRTEKALRESREELIEAQRIAKIGSWTLNLDTDEFTWSEELYRHRNLDPSLPVPTLDEQRQYYTQESWNRLSGAIDKARTNGTPFELELELETGKPNWYIGRGEPVRDEVGRIVKLRGTCQDVTERKAAEEALRLSERRYRKIVETAPEGIVVMDIATGKLVDFNAQALAMFKLTAEEIVGLGPAEMCPEFQPDGRRSAEAIIGNVQRALAGETPAFEWVHCDSNGDSFPCEVRLLLLPDESRQLIRGTVTDISEYKRIEQAIRTSEEQYRALVENSIDIIYTHDLEGNFISINKAGEQITGYSREEAARMGLPDVVAPEFLEIATNAIGRTLAGHGADVLAVEIITKTGRRVAVEITSGVIYQHGVPVAIHGTARDVTDRVHLEQQLRQAQRLESIGRLAGGIAHDFNNMLTAINGYSELALRELSTNDPLRPYVEEIKNAGERSASLTQQLLAFSRKQIMQPRVIDVNSVVTGLEKMLRRLIGEDVMLRTTLAPRLGRILADPSQIEQVIVNLVVNARDAMPTGGKMAIETRRVNIDTELASKHLLGKEGAYIALSVSDDGVGIEDDERQHIFEPFYTTREVGKGTGLGLATVYGIVNQSDGCIELETEPGHGSTFTVYLPVVEETAKDHISGPENSIPFRGSETVLLIEDEEVVRTVINKILTSHGYKVFAAANASEAIAICENETGPIDLIVADVVMPEISGPELTKRLLTTRPEMKVLYVSGYTDTGLSHHGVLDPEINFLQKPFTNEALAQKVRRILVKTAAQGR